MSTTDKQASPNWKTHINNLHSNYTAFQALPLSLSQTHAFLHSLFFGSIEHMCDVGLPPVLTHSLQTSEAMRLEAICPFNNSFRSLAQVRFNCILSWLLPYCSTTLSFCQMRVKSHEKHAIKRNSQQEAAEERESAKKRKRKGAKEKWME